MTARLISSAGITTAVDQVMFFLLHGKHTAQWQLQLQQAHRSDLQAGSVALYPQTCMQGMLQQLPRQTTTGSFREF
jgi:hypothetical protein